MLFDRVYGPVRTVHHPDASLFRADGPGPLRYFRGIVMASLHRVDLEPCAQPFPGENPRGEPVDPIARYGSIAAFVRDGLYCIPWIAFCSRRHSEFAGGDHLFYLERTVRFA